MSLDIQYNQEYCFIETTIKGHITTSEMHEAFLQRIARQDVSGATKVLVDCSAVESSPSVFEILELPKELYAKHSVNRQTEMAVVLPKVKELKEFGSFFEAASSNSGWNVKMFENRKAAIAWLIKDKAADNELPPEN